MDYRRYNDKLIIRIDKGEEIVQTLKKICIENNIRSGLIRGIGATGEAVIGVYDTSKKQYKNIEVKDDYEITSLNGNISLLNNDTILHIHVTLSNHECRVIGGHLHSAYVSVTFEGVIESIDTDIHRAYNQETGLNLISFR